MTRPYNNFPHVPERIGDLIGIAMNLSWSWNREARGLFRMIDRRLWKLTRHNPIELLRRVDPVRLAALATDAEFLRQYDLALKSLATRDDAWFGQTYGELRDRPIAYFCAEFGLHHSVPGYAGGLGVLAGDHCKAASDLGVPLVGVGLFYTKGYFDQRVRTDGWQEDSDQEVDPLLTPLVPVLSSDNSPNLAQVHAAGRCVQIGAWRIMAGTVPVYLLDTDLDGNDPVDRELSHRLYAGGVDLRLRQEWILGVGGVRVLRALGIAPAAWHANEGHAAFMFIERLREMLAGGVPPDEATRQIRATSVFTTHTPVAAGHDVFRPEMVAAGAGPEWNEAGMTTDALVRLGRYPMHEPQSFHMTAAAIRLSGRINGVSERHGRETRRIWKDLWPGRADDTVPIGHVTNGVHLSGWVANPIMDLLDEYLGKDWRTRIADPQLWDRVPGIPDALLWSAHRSLQRALFDTIREIVRQRWRERWQEAAHIVGAGALLNPDAFTIGFARRFATYKRANLVFHDTERLKRLLLDPLRPVQIVYAGKAHPSDDPGKRVLQHVYALSRDPQFEGRIVFVEDYGLQIAHRLVQGVDLWLNLPIVPLEASGTSGMKAALNGVPQLATLDGWWAEGYTGGNGWAIAPAQDGAVIDDHDAEQLYQLLEREIVPLFYTRSDGIPGGWVQCMKQAIRVAGARFTAERMVRQYASEYYAPAIRGEQPAHEPPAE